MLLHGLNKYFIKSAWGKTFLVTLVFLVASSALFWLDYFRAYQTEVSVLFVTKSEQPAPVVADAMGSIMQTLTFAQRADENMEDGALLPETDSKDVQKLDWNTNLSVATKSESGVLVFAQRATTEKESLDKARATLKTLMVATTIYYDQDHQVELRIIDKPITKLVIASWWKYILTVVASAVVLTTTFFLILLGLSRKNEDQLVSSSTESHIGESVVWLDPQKFVAVKPAALEFQQTEESKEETQSSEVLRPAKKVAHAPGNLPIMAGALPQFGIEEVDLVSEQHFPDEEETHMEDMPVVTEEEIFDPTAEPTVEEYKRRLNELLKGKSI